MSKENSMGEEKAYLRKVTWDEEANAIYVKVRHGVPHKTIAVLSDKQKDGAINLDVDGNGKLIGVEILL